MTEVAEKEKTELVTVPEQKNALAVFEAAKGLDPYLQTIRAEIDKFLSEKPSLTTNKGRQAYASMAHKIARSKTAIDTVGKELVAELKEKPKKIDAERKRWRDTLDQWRDEVRGPLNEWEAAEGARKDAHETAIARMIFLTTDIPNLDYQEISNCIAEVEAVVIGEHWEEFEPEAARAKDKALTALRDGLEKRQAYEAEQAELARLRSEAAERERKEREDRIAREAEDRARKQAEEAAQAEREAVARREREVKDAAERREREHQEALAKAKRDAEQAAQRERERYEAQQRHEAEAAAKREADKTYKASINRKALDAFVASGMPEDCAKQAVTLIARRQIPNITINY